MWSFMENLKLHSCAHKFTDMAKCQHCTSLLKTPGDPPIMPCAGFNSFNTVQRYKSLDINIMTMDIKITIACDILKVFDT